jgi:two-component system, NtrC family, sensor histidine kinase GlrK
MNFYPRSLLRLILVGWVLMALPLLVAIAFAALGYAQLATHSEAAMQQVSQATRLGWVIEEDLVHMERILRQYQVLRDPTLLDDYAAARNAWRNNGQELAQVPLLASLASRIHEMHGREAVAYPGVLAAGDSDFDAMRNLLEEFKQSTNRLNVDINQLAETERVTFRATTETLQQRLLIAVGCALLFAGLMFWFGQRVLARLLRSVEHAVILLGNNVLDHRIQLKGPNDLRWIGRRLDWLRRRMLNLEQERTRILRHVSHELKTPLAALREGASLLGEGIAGPLTPQQEKIATIMNGNAMRLQDLIDGLLRLQQAEHLRDRIEPEPLRIDEMIQQALATHKLAARNKHLRITGTLAPLTVAGGREEVITIINNLLSNAIKFSPERGTVKLLLTRSNRDAVLDVFDEGPGVPAADRKMIFEPFYRSPQMHGVAGVGLGLAIAREFATAHNGSLDYLEAANGAHFRATLPLTTDNP